MVPHHPQQLQTKEKTKVPSCHVIPLRIELLLFAKDSLLLLLLLLLSCFNSMQSVLQQSRVLASVPPLCLQMRGRGKTFLSHPPVLHRKVAPWMGWGDIESPYTSVKRFPFTVYFYRAENRPFPLSHQCNVTYRYHQIHHVANEKPSFFSFPPPHIVLSPLPLAVVP